MEENGKSPSKSTSAEVVVAETVFLLMTKDHRISKHLRAKWYLKHVNTVMDFPYIDDSVGHPQVVSVLVNGGEALRPGADGKPVKFKLATDTTSTADTEVLLDKMHSSLQKCVVGLTKTFIIPGSDDVEFVPYLYATVIAYCPLENCPVQQVLTHGYLISHHNVKAFMQYISVELIKFENEVATYFNSLIEQYSTSRKSSITSAMVSMYTSTDCGYYEDEEIPTSNSLKEPHLSPERGFFHLIKNAMLAIHLLPTNCSSGIIVITDGSVGIADVGRYDNLLVQLLSQSCTCSVIEVQCESNERRGLGRVPHSEMLQFIATATFGAYFSDTPCMMNDMSRQMNRYHEGILCWDFKKSIKDFLSIGPNVASMAYENKLRKRCTDYKLSVPINCVITTRLKEGFTIKTVDASKEHFIEVVMVLPWRKNICIEYKAGSVWPVPANNPATNVDICYEGNYHFLHDLTCKKSNTNNNRATKYRQFLVNRFWKSINSLKPIDESLVRMQSFHTQDDFSTIPDSIRKGVALFNLVVNNNTKTLETKSKDTDIEQFANYWRLVICIDLGVPLDKSGLTFDRSSHIMEKWFHITRLFMVLEHDPKHPEGLNIPNSNDKYQGLLCRQAHQALIYALRDWSDFELLENSHYIKYIERQENDSTPISGFHAENWSSFCMIVMNVKAACVTLRLTFLGGTDSIYRTRLIVELKGVLENLHFQKRPEKHKYPDVRISRLNADDEAAQHIPPLQRKWEDRQCCVLLSKPLDRVLVRYNRIPKKILTVDDISQDISPGQQVPSRLANYLYHQRWVWYLQPAGDNMHFDLLDIKSIGNILDVITKLRLQEGYHFSHTSSGIVSMILEVDMTNVPEGVETQIPEENEESLSCLVQYITFPPQRRVRVHDSLSESEVEDESPGSNTNGELTMVTEVWIEPQHGFVANSTSERAHYNGCTSCMWPDKLFPDDQKCITLLVTLDHLLKYCSPLNRCSMSSSLVSGRLEKSSVGDAYQEDDDTSRVRQIPFVFSVIELLPMCQQVEILLPTYHTVSCPDADENADVPNHCDGPAGDNNYQTNDTLFEHIISEISKHPGANEMELTDDECKNFMLQMQDRPRDSSMSASVEPLPFSWPSEEPTLQADCTLYTDRETGSPSVNTTGRGASEESGCRTDRTNPSAADTQADNAKHTSTQPSPPSWKCFCFPGKVGKKSDTIDSVTIMFMPSSYADLAKICPSDSAPGLSGTHLVEVGSATEGEGNSESFIPPLNLNGSTCQLNSTVMGSSSLPLPIYMYHCSRPQLVDSLVNSSPCIKPDEYIDLRFSSPTDSAGSREYRTSYRSDRSDESDRLASPTTTRRRYRNDSGGSRRSFSRATSLDATNATSQSHINLNEYCEEVFYRSFITGIFESLQNGYDISSDDIEFAIEICMETGIFEVELTDFLRHVCSHMSYQLPPDVPSTDQVFLDVAPTTPKSVKFEIPGSEDNKSPLSSADDEDLPSKKQKRSSGSSDSANRPSSLRSPFKERVPCAMLFGSECKTLVSAERIKEKFNEVISNWFKPVPSCKDVYFYSPHKIVDTLAYWYDSSGESSPYSSEDQKTYESEDVELTETYIEDTTMPKDGKRHLFSHSLSLESKDNEIPPPINSTRPLFVHLTASVQNERVNQPVPNIPVCLCELQEGFKNRDTIDIAGAYITLDIICLTLPSGSSDEGPVLENGDAQESILTDTRLADENEYENSMANEILERLSVEQYNDVIECKNRIEWLVRDEIAAAKRSSGPITEDTLKMVAEHVKGSQNETTCRYSKERLDYVFGPETSHPMFIEEFERMNVTGYQLIKNGDYYYLSIDRARLATASFSNPVQHQLENVATILGGIHHVPSTTSPTQANHPDNLSLRFDRSFEVLPVDTNESSKVSLPCVASEPGPKFGSADHWAPNNIFPSSSASKAKVSSKGESSDSFSVLSDQEDADCNEETTGPIPISGALRYTTTDNEEETSNLSLYKEKLSSLPQRNQIEEWNRDEDEFGSKCGSLPKAFSSCNVNVDRSTERRILKRVSSGPQDLNSSISSCKRKIRHASEDTGRKRATFAEDILSPPSSSTFTMSMKECRELEANRSRNPSGPMTPLSARMNGSTGSAFDTTKSELDPGYEADLSDDEGTGGGLSLVELGTRSHLMPEFWLIMRVHSEKSGETSTLTNVKDTGHRLTSAHADLDTEYRVDVFFHTSETVHTERHFSDSLKGNIPKNKLFTHTLGEIKKACKLVNQRLLLRDLENKRRCDVLLEEDWDAEPFPASESKHTGKQHESDGEMGNKSEEDDYLYARTKFKQGHFKCDLKWEKVFQLHPRLKCGKNKHRGVKELRSGLSNLAITNRSNMFVLVDTRTQNIFYLRLSECGEPVTPLKSDGPDDTKSAEPGLPAAISRNSSAARLREESDSSRRPSFDNEDMMSVSSRSSILRRSVPTEDGVKLSVYGIDPVGTDIKVQLVKMLETRLDKAVLVEIETLLSRNPNCMLTAQDAHFLQGKEMPMTSLKLSLPDDTLHHQIAVLHYLRQNLLLQDLFFHPKYHDPDRRFMDYTDSLENASPMADCDTFLYNKSTAYHKKGSGLTLMYLQLVDSLNQPKSLLECPQPDMDAWKGFDKSMFERLTTVKELSSADDSTSMSTSSYVTFSIWSKGEVDVGELKILLTKLLRYSLCDFVCEYYAFTAPLCEVPADVYAQAAANSAANDSHCHPALHKSDKTTPVGTKSATSSGKHTMLSKSKSLSASVFSFSIDSIRTRTGIASPPPTYSYNEKLLDSVPDSQTVATKQEINKYRFGEKGHLLPFYTTTLIEWFEYCTSMGMPALTKVSCGLLNGCIVDPIMKEFEVVVRELPGVSIRAFRLIDNKYIPYETSRAPLAENAECEDTGFFSHLDFPYSVLSHGHILTVRNKKLWIDSIGDGSVDGPSTPLSGSVPRASKTNQKFPPAYAGMESSLSLSSSQATFSSERQLLPRQQFLMLVVKNGELVLYSYNLADGKDDMYQQHIMQNATRITRWNNARFHLLHSIAHQKMGLFQHASIQNIPPEKHCEENSNKYTSTYEDTCRLAKSSRPVAETPTSQTSRMPPGSRLNKPPSSQSPVTTLDNVFRGFKPSRPMHLSPVGQVADPITRHGSQLIETLNNEKRDHGRRTKLENLYNNWLQRIGPMSTEINEDQLDLLKQSSRLVHHVATPLLFSPYWRAKAMNLPRTIVELQKMEEERQSFSQRSRNNSGASARSAMADRVSIARDSPITVPFKAYEEEPWHEEMRTKFVNNYIEYLRQTQQPLEQLGFTTIKINTKPVNRGFSTYHRKHSSGGSGCEQLVRRRTTDSLQKTMAGGIFLIELCFQEVYFVVKLYVFSASQLSIYKQPSHTSKKYLSYFIEMCDRMRDNTHCHSFAHDFHLRAVHKYVKYSKEFHPTYHLVRLLRDFVTFYSEAPRFSRNAVALKGIQLDSANNPCDKLYEHILHHESQKKMRKITMSDYDTSELKEEMCEYGLVYLATSEPPASNRRHGEYEVSVIICHDHPEALRHMILKDKLNLAFFVVLVNKEQPFPADVAHNRSSTLSADHLVDLNQADRLSVDSSISCTSLRQIRMFSTRWTNGPCGMGYSQERRSSDQFPEILQTIDGVVSTQHPTFGLLNHRCNAVCEKLTKLVEEASLQYRKSFLWIQMFSSPNEPIRRSASDLFNQQSGIDLLTFKEFEELSSQVTQKPLGLQENLHSVLKSMSMDWYTALCRVLSSKYENLYREFADADRQVIHSVVLIPENEEVVIRLSINSEKGVAELMLMFLDNDTEDILNDETFSKSQIDFINTICFHMWAHMGKKE